MATHFNYARLKFKRTDRLNEINKSTKDMIINSSKFTNYLNDYTNAIQVPTFKTPEVSCYPILKNFFLIPLNRLYNYKEEQKQKLNRQFSSMKIVKNTKKAYPMPGLATARDSIEKKPMSSLKKKMRVSSASCVSTANRERSLNRDNSNFQRGCLINAFFPDWCFDMVYDESFIFNKGEHYKKFINEKMNFIKDNNIENMTSVIQSKFNEGTLREMGITLSSMKIEFHNKTNESKKSTVIYLPFSYLFLFYFQGIEYFEHILLGIIKFNDANDQITLDEQCLYEILRNNPSLLNMNTNNTTEESRPCDSPSVKPKHHSSINTNQNSSSKRGEQAENSGNSPFLSKKEPRHFNTLSQNAYNNYSFTWVSPKDLYQISISLPEVMIILQKTQVTISRFLDKELVLFFLETNFLNWDFYIIHFLFSLKDFRLFIEKMLSKKSTIKASSKNLTIKKAKHIVSLSPLKAHDFSLEDFTFSYFYSGDNDKNSLHVLHSYSVKVFFSKLKAKKYLFDFTFKQMFILNKILIQTGNLEAFIMKILITDSSNGVIQLNYAFFDHFDEEIFKDEEKFEMGEKSNKTNIKGIDILIDKPYLVRLYSDSPYMSNDIMTMPISSDIISEIEEKELSLWPKVLMNQSNFLTSQNSSTSIGKFLIARKNSKTQSQVQSQILFHKSINAGGDPSLKKRPTIVKPNTPI